MATSGAVVSGLLLRDCVLEACSLGFRHPAAAYMTGGLALLESILHPGGLQLGAWVSDSLWQPIRWESWPYGGLQPGALGVRQPMADYLMRVLALLERVYVLESCSLAV